MRGRGRLRTRPHRVRPALRRLVPRAVRDLVATDPVAMAAVLTLVVLGELNLVAIGAGDLALHQAVAVLLGLALVLGLQRLRASSLPWLGRALYAAALLMLIAVDVTGSRAYGAQRWLSIGSFELQPSELAKLGLLLVLAETLAVRRLRRGRVALALLLAAGPVTLTLLQPDLSTTALLVTVLLASLVLARVPVRIIALLVAAGAAAGPLALRSLHGYQSARIHAFLGGGADPQGAGYSALQAHIAIASGGSFGIARAPLHQLLAEYLPARHTDLAFASLVEQWGLAAGAAALAAVALLVWRLVATARMAADPVPALVAGTLAVLVSAEAAISVAGNLGSAPLAGVPFPLLSYGGTAASAHLAALGIVLGARRQASHRFLRRVPVARLSPRLVRATGAGLCTVMVTLGCAAYRDQQATGTTFAAYGVDQMTRCTVLPAARGLIEDRHGTPVAVNDSSRRVFAVPAFVLEDPGAPAILAAVLGRPVAELVADLRKHPTSPGLELGTLPKLAADRLDAAHLASVVTIPSPRRHYPAGALLGPILGFTGVITAEDLPAYKGYAPGSLIGRSGIERQYDALLRGQDGRLCVLVDPQNRPVTVSDLVLPRTGTSVRLSIDLDLQRRADDALQKVLVGDHKADLASVVVLDAKTGHVLAMASEPSYDNNIFGPPIDLPALEAAMRAPGNAMLEHATQIAVAPGSTFKLVVASADTVYNAIPPAQVIPTGYTYTMGTSTIHGWGYLPPQNLSQAIAWSNDVYFYKLGVALGPERMADVAARLGVGSATGIDLPGETPGLLGTPAVMDQMGEPWWPATTAFMGIGQGYLTATPMQVARWTAAVATGNLLTPRLGFAQQDALDEKPTALALPSAVPLDFAGSLGPVRDGMRQAVTGGTANMLASIPLAFGGKTGSAEDPSTAGGVNAWFTCAGPMDSPEVVATAMFRGGGEGHEVAEPLVADLMRWYTDHRHQVRDAGEVLPPPAPDRQLS